jgi:hypothetical protein
MIKLKDIEYKGRSYNLSYSQFDNNIKSFITNIFFEKHHAKVNYFQDNFLVISENFKILAVIGYKMAEKNVLLIESYTNTPVDKLLNNITRDKIIEVGNLSSVGSGLGQIIISSLVAFLSEQDYHWLFLTAPEKILNTMKKIGLSFTVVSEANKSDVSNPDDWGTYYDNKPYVIALDIKKNKEILNKFMTEKNHEKLSTTY